MKPISIFTRVCRFQIWHYWRCFSTMEPLRLYWMSHSIR